MTCRGRASSWRAAHCQDLLQLPGKAGHREAAVVPISVGRVGSCWSVGFLTQDELDAGAIGHPGLWANLADFRRGHPRRRRRRDPGHAALVNKLHGWLASLVGVAPKTKAMQFWRTEEPTSRATWCVWRCSTVEGDPPPVAGQLTWPCSAFCAGGPPAQSSGARP